MNVIETRMRVRVRPIEKVHKADRKAVAKLNCLSAPHVGEAIDRAADSYRLREASQGRAWERELHFQHAPGLPECGERCLYLDYVPETQPKDDDEIEVAGLVAKSK